MFLSNVHTCSRRRSETPHQTRSPISLTWWWTNRSCRWWFEEELRRYLRRLLLLTDVRDRLASLHSDFTQLMPHNLVHFLLHPHWNGFLGISPFMFASFMSFACIVEMFCFSESLSITLTFLVNSSFLCQSKKKFEKVESMLLNSWAYSLTVPKVQVLKVSIGSTELEAIIFFSTFIYLFMCSFLLSHVFPELVLTTQ